MNMVSRFIKDQDGVFAVIFALLLPVIIGGIVLGVETGLWFMHRAKLQHIADTATYSAAIRYASGATEAQALATANAIAVQSGFDPSLGSVVLTRPETDLLSVTLTRDQARLFSAIFLDQDFVITASATAQFGDTPPIVRATCMQALQSSRKDTFDMEAQSRLTLPANCDVIVNSTNRRALSMLGETTLTAGCLEVAGGARMNGTLNMEQCAAPATETGTTYSDPFVSRPEPAVFGACQDEDVGKKKTTTRLTPTQLHPSGERVMRFCDGLVLSGTVIFDPGLYIIEDDDMEASDDGALVSTPNGATFYFRDGGAPDFSDDLDGSLTPSKSGPWTDILIFGSRDAGGDEEYKFGDNNLTGIITAPRARVEFDSKSDNTGCFQIVSSRILIERRAQVTMDCTASSFQPGGTPVANNGPGEVSLIK